MREPDVKSDKPKNPKSKQADSHEDPSYSGPLNANIYVRLLNSNNDPDVISRQLTKGGIEAYRFATEFLAKRCKKLQNIFSTVYNVAIEGDVEKSMASVVDALLNAIDTKYVTFCKSFSLLNIILLDIFDTKKDKLSVRASNWQPTTTDHLVDNILCGSTLLRGDPINLYNIKESDAFGEDSLKARNF